MNLQKEGWVSLEGPFTWREIRALQSYEEIEKLALTKQPLITTKVAKGFEYVNAVRWLWLWCSITRTAMRHVISIPGLETLDVLEIRHPGRLEGFSSATKLKVFRANHYMSESDLLEVCKLPALEELSAQNAVLTDRSFDAILDIPGLKKLDIESTEFDDEMAFALAKKTSVVSLEIGATNITRKGLEHIARMSQLQSLDIWATRISEDELETISNLPNLEYLSVGGYQEQTLLKSKGVLPLLENLPSLKKIWLDGVPLSETELELLEQRYEYVRN